MRLESILKPLFRHSGKRGTSAPRISMVQRDSGQARMTGMGAGFTLVELIVVIGIIGVLGTIGIGSFLEYSHSQAVNIAANSVIDTLNTARSNSLSQLKPSSCGAISLDGYKVRINNSKTYSLIVTCAGADFPILNKVLPANVIFASTTPSTFFFTVLTGKVVVTGSLNITISGLGKIRNITVSSTGVIQ